MNKLQTQLLRFIQKMNLPAFIVCLALTFSTKMNAQTTIFSEDWASSTYTANGWTFDPSVGNWVGWGSYTPTGGTLPNAYFNWSPSFLNYTYSLVSPVINGTAYGTVTLDYLLQLNNYSTATLEQFKVEYKSTGAGTWNLLENFTNTAGTFNISRINQNLTGLGGTNFQIRFTAYGANSFNINGWGLDNIVVKGVGAAGPCTGTPAPGNTLSSVNPVCSGSSFTLTTQYGTTGTGVTYQWQSSPTGASYSNIAGATNANYTTTEAASTYYRCNVTCAAGPATGTSNPLQVTMATTAVCGTWCTPSTSVPCTYMYINNFSTTGGTTNITNNLSGCSTAGYGNFTPTAMLLSTTGGSSFNISVQGEGVYAQGFHIWVDWNNNGLFTDAGEDAWNSVSFGTGIYTGTISVPPTATPGYTRMRIRSDYSVVPPDPCAVISYGETEDYSVFVSTPAPCTGTPAPGNTLSTTNPVCTSSSFTLSLQYPTTGTGVTYQWQSSPTGASYTNIAGATSYTLSTTQTTATYYRCNVTCATGPSTGTSNPIYITMNPFTSCYCSSMPTQTADEEIYSVTINGVNNSLPCGSTAPGAGSIAYKYSNFQTLGSLTSLFTATPTSFNVEENECDGATYYAFGTSIWIDLNHNGSFADAGEQVFVEGTTATGPRNVSGTFTIPVTAMSGVTGMRVTCAEGYSGASLTPCLSYGYGETEDYLVNISAPAVCTGTPTAGSIPTTMSVCTGTAVTITDVGYSTGVSGITFQWQESATGVGGWSNVTTGTGGTTYSYTTPALAANNYYRCVVTCTTSGFSATTNVCSAIVTTSPTGDLFTNPLIIASLPYSTSGNNQTANCWHSDYTGALPQASPDIFYKVIPGCNGTMNISLCGGGSLGDTYLHLLDATGTALTSNDDNGPLCAGLLSSITYTVSAGVTYYIVVEGYSTNEGTYSLSVSNTALYSTWFYDGDGDTYGFAGTVTTTCDGIAPGGYVGNNLDCNDTNPLVNPDATETCNGFDDDCDALIDDSDPGIVGLNTWFADADGDGFGDGMTYVEACFPPTGYTGDPSDCNDADASINPGAAEICNGFDDNCDVLIDDEDPTVTGGANWYADGDGDGFGDPASVVVACNGPAGYILDGSDCDDTHILYQDGDGDGYGVAVQVACGALVTGDCNDEINTIYPGAAETCNAMDDDCNGLTDDGLTFTVYYADMDADGFGDAASTTSTCDGLPAGYVTDLTDCDDTHSAVNPSAPEICDGLDNDCNGSIDEGTVTATITPAPTAVTCKGVVLTFQANSGVGYTYQWFKNGNLIPGATSQIYSTDKAGYYQVQVNSPAGCFALSDATLLSINPNPNSNISAPNGTSLCTTVKLKASYDASYIWQWYKDGVSVGAGGTGYLYFPTLPGSYYCLITNTYGCSRATPAMSVTACKAGDVAISEDQISVYPNPTDQSFTIELVMAEEINGTADIYVMNITGSAVYTTQSTVTNGFLTNEIDLGNEIAAGVYLVKVVVDGKSFNQQISIVR